MKGNSISLKTLNEGGKLWLAKTFQLLKVQEYGKGTHRHVVKIIKLHPLKAKLKPYL